MRLTYICSGCSNQNFLREKENNRGVILMKTGSDELRVKCKGCGKAEKKHLNKLVAVADYRIIIFGILVGIVVSLFLVYWFGLIATITLSIPIYIWSLEQNKAHRFNIYRIRK